MKGIPLTFRGFFRNAVMSANINQLGTIRPTWTITNVSNNIEYLFDRRLSGSRSEISFRDSAAQERDIKFFYPIDRITALSLSNLTLIELPSSTLTSLTTLNISNNDFRTFPDLSAYTQLSNLNISNNNLTRGSNVSLRTFSQAIADRLPAALRTFTVGNCFTGVSTIDLSDIPLVTLNLNSGNRTNRRLSGISPKIDSTSIENYNISWNLFTNIDESVKESSSLKQLILDHNNLTSNDIRADSAELTDFSSIGNTHNLVSVTGKTKLIRYQLNSSGRLLPGDSTVTNIFDGCTALTTIELPNTPVTGALPGFVNCNSLTSINFLNTTVTDAVPATLTSPPYVVGENTFNSCRNTLARIRIRSNRFSPLAELHPDCFRLMPALTFLEITSSNSGIAGNLPSFLTTRNITHILLYSNRLTGLIPNFDSNERLFFLNLANNRLTGPVPNIKTTALRHLILTNNQLTSLPEIESTQLVRLHLSFNNITSIPNLSNLTRLQQLLMNNQRLGNSTFSYTADSFVGLSSLRTLNLTNNSISQGFVDQILLDLSKNYDLNPRRGVVINLRGNTPPSDSSDIQDAIRKLQIGGWTVLVD
jgi:Leucine-rich repeat (LRR) protein